MYTGKDLDSIVFPVLPYITMILPVLSQKKERRREEKGEKEEKKRRAFCIFLPWKIKVIPKMYHLDHISGFLRDYLSDPNPFFFSLFCKAGTLTLTILFPCCKQIPVKICQREQQKEVKSRKKTHIYIRKKQHG